MTLKKLWRTSLRTTERTINVVDLGSESLQILATEGRDSLKGWADTAQAQRSLDLAAWQLLHPTPTTVDEATVIVAKAKDKDSEES